MDAVGDVLFGGGLPEERRRFQQRLVGQVEGAPVDGESVGVLWYLRVFVVGVFKMVKNARHVALPRDASAGGSAVDRPFERQSRRVCIARLSLTTSSTVHLEPSSSCVHLPFLGG